jgi:hypothetical protein
MHFQRPQIERHGTWHARFRFVSGRLRELTAGLAICIVFVLCSASPARALSVVSMTATSSCDAIASVNVTGATGAVLIRDGNGILIWAGVANGLRPFATFEPPTTFSQWTVIDVGTSASITFAPSSFATQCAPGTFAVSAGDLDAYALQGGTVTPGSKVYTLTNTGGGTVFPLVSPSFPGGTAFFNLSGVPTSIGPASSVNVTVTFTGSASSMPLGAYNATVSFSDATTLTIAAIRNVNLTIVGALTMEVTPSAAAALSGNQGGPFSPFSITYQLTSSTGTVNYSVSGLPPWLTASSTSGTLTTTPTNVNFTTNANANGLSSGVFNATIVFTNTTNGQGNQTRLVTLTVNTAGSPAQLVRTFVSGTGDDANSCSRTAPCKTFAGAISKTSAGGEIDALDPGGFGAVTITKAITLDGGGGQVASILVASGNGINVAAGANDVVIIRNIRFNGLLQTATPGLNGISFTSGALVSVENCWIFGFSQAGINVTTGANATLNVTNTNITNAANGINLAPTAGTLVGEVDHTTIQKLSSNGITTNAGSVIVTVTNSNILNAAGVGVHTGGGGTVLGVDSSSVSSNNTAFSTSGGTIRITRNVIYDNNTNFTIAGGTIASAGNNMVAVNGVTIPNGTVTQQ